MYLGDELVAEVATPRTGKMTLTYRSELVERLEPGALVLSAALPSRAERFSPSEAAPFLDGLLPDGWARAGLERRFDVHRVDSFSLLVAVGRECAGAVSLVPSGTPWPPAPEPLVGLEEAEVEARLAGLGDDPFGVDDVTRVTLAGTPWKLPLTIGPDGRWAAPTSGRPSTHLLRPEPGELKGQVVAEGWALEVMRRAGMHVIDAEVTTVERRPVLVARRYDRTIGPDGDVARIHQEDCCQALGAPRSERFEHSGGPSLREVAQLVEEMTTDPERELRRLLAWVTACLVFGKVDGTARDLSLVYGEESCELAPVSSMGAVAVAREAGDRSHQLGMAVHRVDDGDRVGATELIAEAGAWGIGEPDAGHLVSDLLERLASSLESARELVDAGDDVVAACRSRLDVLSGGT